MATKKITKSGASRAKATTPPKGKSTAGKLAAPRPRSLPQTASSANGGPGEKGIAAPATVREYFFGPFEFGIARWIDAKVSIRSDDLVTLTVHVQSNYKTQKGGPSHFVTLRTANGRVFAKRIRLGNEMKWGCGQNGILQSQAPIAGAFKHTGPNPTCVTWEQEQPYKGPVRC